MNIRNLSGNGYLNAISTLWDETGKEPSYAEFSQKVGPGFNHTRTTFLAKCDLVAMNRTPAVSPAATATETAKKAAK